MVQAEIRLHIYLKMQESAFENARECIYIFLLEMVPDKFFKLKDAARNQVLWFTKEMIRNQAPNTDGLCWILMRQIAGGDVNQKTCGWQIL